MSESGRMVRGLLCMLAVCCTIMYFTVDGGESEEAIHLSRRTSLGGVLKSLKSRPKRSITVPAVIPMKAVGVTTKRLPDRKIFKHTNLLETALVKTVENPKVFLSGNQLKQARKVLAKDILKASNIHTETPKGAHGSQLMMLKAYLDKIENSIATERATRKWDIASVRSQMAKNLAVSRKARSKMKKMMLSKMAAANKSAHDHFKKMLRKTHEKMAKQTALANKRNRANLARSRATMKQVNADKRASAHALRMAVLAQQRAQSAFAASANSKIDQANKHAAANAAQIKENARKARKALEGAMHSWQKKIDNFKAESKKGLSKVAEQWSEMNKKTRQMANNKLHALVASTAARFRRTRKKMAANRHRFDMAVKHSAQRLSAALNTQKALGNKRYAQTISNIKKARAEANVLLGNAKKEFKVSSLALMTTVKRQVAKINSSITNLAGVVKSNKAEQAKVNRNVAAELKRMAKLGAKRNQQLLSMEKNSLASIMSSHSANQRRLVHMGKRFQSRIKAMHKQMAADRKLQEHNMKRATSGLYSQLQKVQAQAAQRNAASEEATRRMRLDAMDSVRKMKRNFIKRFHQLGSQVASSQRKFSSRMDKLTGIVRANDIKNTRGRALLRKVAKSQKNYLNSVLSKAVHRGEQRAQKMMQNMKQMNSKLRASVSQKLNCEIKSLAKRAANEVNALSLENKAARAALKKEMMYAIKSAASVAKKNLKSAVIKANKRFAKLKKKQAAAANAGKLAAKKLAAIQKKSAAKIAASLANAVATQNRALLAFKTVTAKRISSTTRRITAAARQMKKNAKQSVTQMKVAVQQINMKIRNARTEAKMGAGKLKNRDAARWAASLKMTQKAMASAERKSKKRFGTLYNKMAKDRAQAARKLQSATKDMNKSLAKQAALEDARFRKTVKNIAKARAAAQKEVRQARKFFTSSMVTVRSAVKGVETRIKGEMAVVSGEVTQQKTMQAIINRKVKKEMKNIINVSNSRRSESLRARGKLRAALNRNKRLASMQVKALAKRTQWALGKLRHRLARNRRTAARALTAATKKLFGRMASLKAAKSKVKGKVFVYSSKAAAFAALNALREARTGFAASLTTMANTITAMSTKYTRALSKLTGVKQNLARASIADRRLLKQQRKAMLADLNKSMVNAVQLGEAKMKQAIAHVKLRSKSMNGVCVETLSEFTEQAADREFRKVAARRKVIANNYLNMKGFSLASKSKIIQYAFSNHGANLQSIGDFLKSVALVSAVRPRKVVGVGLGGPTIPELFTGKRMKLPYQRNKINGLVNEYTVIVTQVRQRWPWGIGKYIMDRIDVAMQNKGILEVAKLSGRSGQFVFLNAHSLGLSASLPSWKRLAARISDYSAALEKLSRALPTTVSSRTRIPKPFRAKPPQWQGN